MKSTKLSFPRFRSIHLFSLILILGLAWLLLASTSFLIGGVTWDELWDFEGVDGSFWHGVNLLRGHHPDISKITFDLEWFGNSTRWITYIIWRFLCTLPAWDSLQGFDRWSFVLASGYVGLNHLNAVFFGFIGVVLTGAIGLILGGRLQGCISAFLLVLLPSWLGHSWMNSKDIPMATCYLLYSLGSTLLLCARTNRSFGSLGLWARLFGIALITGARVSSIVFVLVSDLILTVSAHNRLDLRRILVSLFGGLTTGLLLTPQAWGDPFGYPLQAIQFIGQRQTSGNPLETLSYLLTNFFDRLPILQLIGLLAFCCFAISSFITPPRPSKHLLFFPILLQLLVSPVLLVLSGKSIYNELRHVLFIWPPICILGASGYCQAYQLLRIRIRLLRFCQLVSLCLAFLLASEIFLLHPYQYTYKSDLSRILSTASSQTLPNLNRDYWGFSVRETLEDCIKSDHCKTRLMHSKVAVSDSSFEPALFRSLLLLVQPRSVDDKPQSSQPLSLTTDSVSNICSPIASTSRLILLPTPRLQMLSKLCSG